MKSGGTVGRTRQECKKTYLIWVKNRPSAQLHPTRREHRGRDHAGISYLWRMTLNPTLKMNDAELTTSPAITRP